MVASFAAEGVHRELARAGNCHAIAYWLNRHLIPAGLYAFVGNATAGCLQVQVELPQLPHQQSWQPQLVRAICHPLWALNSEAIEGVRIITRLAGQSEVLWEQSVRIVTPANQNTRRPQPTSGLNVQLAKLWRMCVVVGTSAAAFLLGCWLSYHDFSVRSPLSQTLSQTAPAVVQTAAATPPLDRIRTALDSVPVVRPPVRSPNAHTVTLTLGGQVDLNRQSQQLSALSVFPDADLAAVNLDAPPHDIPQALASLTQAGIDVVNLSGESWQSDNATALSQTLNDLDRAVIGRIGSGHHPRDARRPQVLEVKGQRFAFLSYALDDGETLENVPGRNRFNGDRLHEDIAALRATVDWVVVHLEWDGQLSSYPAPWQMDVARLAVDEGADLVLGHHPETVQGGEIYGDRPIVYSLGNLSHPDAPAVLSLSATQTASQKTLTLRWLPLDDANETVKLATRQRRREILQYLEDLSYAFDRPLTTPTTLELPRDTTPTTTEDRDFLDFPADGSPDNDAFDLDPFLAPGAPPTPDNSPSPFPLRDDPPARSTVPPAPLDFGQPPRLRLPFEAESSPSLEIE